MTIKRAERKERYIKIQQLMLKNKNREAFDEICAMSADDTKIFFLGDYDKCIAKAKATPNELEGSDD